MGNASNRHDQDSKSKCNQPFTELLLPWPLSVDLRRGLKQVRRYHDETTGAEEQGHSSYDAAAAAGWGWRCIKAVRYAPMRDGFMIWSLRFNRYRPMTEAEFALSWTAAMLGFMAAPHEINFEAVVEESVESLESPAGELAALLMDVGSSYSASSEGVELNGSRDEVLPRDSRNGNRSGWILRHGRRTDSV
jgi:hypothetical protein